VCGMRATKLLVATGVAIFVIFFSERLLGLHEQVDLTGRAALGVFELCGVAGSLYLLSRGNSGNASFLDWMVCGSATLFACTGLATYSISLFPCYLFVRDRSDQNAKAAGTVAAAVAIQAFWAPLTFSKISFFLLQIDAGVVGWIVSYFEPGTSWKATIIYTPSGHNVAITAPCASFHNLSLASLCWVTLTMLHRPYWVKGDFYIGLFAALIQFGFNVWRLVFVCLTLPMYEFWHDGFGKHIFTAVATAFAIIFVQTWLLRFDKDRNKAAFAILSAR
jgi:hypothetical protein